MALGRDGEADISDPFTHETAARTLEQVCQRASLDSAGAELVRIGENAVFRLREPVIVRIARTSRYADAAAKEVAVARWLESAGYPATRALDVEQPIVVDGRVATVWESVSEHEEYGDIGQVATLIRDLHRLDPPETLKLPELDPFVRADTRLAKVRGVSDDDLAFLHEGLADARRKWNELEFVLPRGPVHGDASIGNVIRASDGHAVLIDLDGFATGPREWDLIQTAMYYDRFGWHTHEEYETFVGIYDYDLLEWPGYHDLAAIREVLMTIWLSQKAGDDARSAAEVHNRVDDMRTGASRRDWAPY
ncbi:Thiamine kinase [Actinopolyspora alba]|uniref:Thiamine kinase n=1 Tax=Actinopolyspora alba TaxID=673379 RepID=A0A1I1XWD2_9ACTN|nr:aminoglycoside phosphotransferase family protein [Actinopolyspora alba]SFE11581.1 Thiamine kinase [Actinopolyspora alba]